jgi:hypothetical protein
MIKYLIVHLFLFVLLLSGCENGEKTRIPNLSPILVSTISKLREAMETLEGYGHQAKYEIRRNSEAQTLYIKAVAKHNSCISCIGTGLANQIDESELRTRLIDADASRTELIDWCNRREPRRRPKKLLRTGATYTSCGEVGELATDFLVGIIAELLNYDIQLKELDQKMRKMQIDQINQELNNCTCRQWNEL